MQFTVFSFISAVLWSNAFIITLFGMRKVDKSKQYVGVVSISLLYLLSLCRMVFPLEFDNTIVLESANIYSGIYHFLHSKWILGFSAITFFIVTWISVAGLLLVQYTISYYKAVKQIMDDTVLCGDQEQSILKNVISVTHQRIIVSLVKSKNIDIPIGLGILKKFIVLPDYSYRDDELYYILLHEYTHFINRDILVKFLVSIFCIIFWWNPFVYLLKRDLEQTLEIKCDLTITKKFVTQQKKEYLQTIINVLKRVSQKHQPLYMSNSFLKQTQSDYIKERFETVLYYKSTLRHKICTGIVGTLCFFVIAISYSFIPKPVFQAPDSTNWIDTFEFSSSNAYIQKTVTGNYQLVIQDLSQIEISQKEADFLKKEGFLLKEE